MQSTEYRPSGGWGNKFSNAFRGVARGMRGQSSFAVHVVMAGLVLLAGFLMQLNQVEWCLIVLCIAIVISAELFNSSLETMARTIDRTENYELARPLTWPAARC